MDYKQTKALLEMILDASQGNSLNWDDHDYDATSNTQVESDEEISEEEWDEYSKDRDEYRRQTRLLEQRKKEYNSLKAKLKRQVKKADEFIAQLKVLVEKYGHLENSADLLATMLLEDDDEVTEVVSTQAVT
jgi:TATA-binding protein-associated factor Taf7